MPPTYSPEHPYGDVRRRHQHSRIKIESRKVTQMPKVEMTYLGCTGVTQPCGNNLKQSYGVVGPCHRDNWIKIIPGKLKIKRLNDKRGQNGKRTYQRCARATQPRGNPSRGCLKVYRPHCQPGRIKIEPVKVKIKGINNKKAQDNETAYLGRARLMQPPGNHPKCRYRVIGLIHRHGHIKSRPRNVKQMERSGRTYLEHGNAIWSIWRPKKGIKRFNKLTFKCRKPGEPWRDVEDHG